MDSSALWNITIELVKRGYTEDQIRKIWDGYMMRIMYNAQQSAN